MKYQFNLKLQLIYGVIGFILSLIIIYLFLGNFDWLTSGIIGLFEFIIAGFYTQMSKKKIPSKKKI